MVLVCDITRDESARECYRKVGEPFVGKEALVTNSSEDILEDLFDSRMSDSVRYLCSGSRDSVGKLGDVAQKIDGAREKRGGLGTLDQVFQ